jgi:predicted dehydrogenase/threonine dehydrogenase-like Zn-dependent dehydrogenase
MLAPPDAATMKQLAHDQSGRFHLEAVPRPTAPPGGLLVRVTHSVISAGTERMKLEQARMSLLQKARARPDQLRAVLDAAKTLGWQAAIEKVRNRLETPAPLGYSAAGIVEAVGSAVTRFRVGDRAAVGGAEWAFHAEYVAVPELLAARVPDGVENWEAAYTTIASIALQAVRQLQPTLGERVLVMGQGLVGLLVTAILRANGVRVIAADLAQTRRSFAEQLGAERVVILDHQSLSDEVDAWSQGYGVDGVVLCTASQSNAPLEQSAEALRDRGRIVIVGNTKAELSWRTFYRKELELRYSRSYGPGRYDPNYESAGLDYPLGHVRWTVQRNFETCLHLMQTGALNLAALTTRRSPFSEALVAYRDLLADQPQDVGVVLEYGHEPLTTGSRPVTAPRRVRRPTQGPATAGAPRLASPVTRLDAIGAGNFARTMLLPHVRGVTLGTVVNQTGLSAHHAQKKFGFAAAATDPAVVFADQATAAVLIATRDQLHAPLVLAALAAHRHVFVEKPLCINRSELTAIDAALARSSGSVQVGFNRRFARASLELQQLLRSTPGPKTASYRVVPGRLDPHHWYANHHDAGGRVLGEVCHFLDYLCFLFDTKPVRVLAQATWPPGGRCPFPDSIAAQVEFADGSCGQLIYAAEGDTSWPKEQCTVYGAGFVAEITNFLELRIRRGRKQARYDFRSKGHAEEIGAWLAFLRAETEHPFPYEKSRKSMLVTFAALDSLQLGQSVDV